MVSMVQKLMFPKVKKKDDSKQTNFYNPIRESFEDELERV